MKFAKALLVIFCATLTLYFGVFSFWLIMVMGCLQHADQNGYSDCECGQDLMSQTIRTTHAPLISLMFSSK